MLIRRPADWWLMTTTQPDYHQIASSPAAPRRDGGVAATRLLLAARPLETSLAKLHRGRRSIIAAASLARLPRSSLLEAPTCADSSPDAAHAHARHVSFRADGSRTSA